MTTNVYKQFFEADLTAGGAVHWDRPLREAHRG